MRVKESDSRSPRNLFLPSSSFFFLERSWEGQLISLRIVTQIVAVSLERSILGYMEIPKREREGGRERFLALLSSPHLLVHLSFSLSLSRMTNTASVTKKECLSDKRVGEVESEKHLSNMT